MITTLLFAAAHAAAPMSFGDVTVAELPNGLVVILDEVHRTDTVALHLAYGVGSRDERPGEYGCAHLFEHLMFEGSANVPVDAFDRWMTAAGGSNNAYTSEDVTAYHETFPSSALDVILFLESDRMGFLDAGIDARNVANQQDVVLQERAQGYAEPGGRDWDALSRVSWAPEHPYHRPVIGTVADIRAFGPDQVLAFWKRHYRPRNAVLALSGNIDADAALGRLQHWFSDVPDVGPAPERQTEADVAERVSGKARHGVVEDDIEERTLWMSFPAVSRFHDDAPAVQMLTRALSDGRGTRFDERLIYKKQRANDAGLFSLNNELGGQVVAYASSERTSLPRLRAEIIRVVDDVLDDPVTAQELERARSSARSGLLDAMESVEWRAEQLVDCYRARGRADCLAEEWAEVEAVTPADLDRVAHAYLRPDAASTVSVVPRGDTGALPGAVPVELP